MANQDQLQGLLGQLADENHIESNLPFVLESISNNRYLDDESSDLSKFHKWITRLNSLLHSKNSTARWASISLIKATCEQSSKLYHANVASWVLNILNILTRPEPTSVHDMAIKTLTLLFAKTADKPEVQREVTSPNLPKFNHTLLNLSGNRDLLPAIFDAFMSGFTHFPTTSRPAADNCRKLCLSLLDGSSDNRFELTEKAASCLSTIFLTATVANRGEMWRNTAMRLLGTANRSLDRLFDTIDEESNVSDRLPAYDFPPVMSEYQDAFIILFNRVSAINEALVKTLTTSTNATVSVPVAQIVDYLCRIYNVNNGSLMRDFKDNGEYNCLMAGTHKLLLSANRVFATLIHCCGTSLLRYLRLFSSLLLQLLSQNKHKRVLKASLYEVLTLCLQKFGVGFGEMICKPLLGILFEDLRLPKKRITPVAKPAAEHTSAKGSGKKRKRDLTNSDEIAFGTVEDSPLSLLFSGLEVLQALLITYGSSLSAEQRSTIDSLIITRIMNDSYQLKASSNDERVTEKLYECLLASVMKPIETQASTLPHALRIFSAGANSQSHRLRVICIQALSVCELVMHSRLPPIPRTESKAAAVVYIPGLGNLVDPKSLQDDKVASKTDEDQDMEDRYAPREPVKSFADEMSNMSQKPPAAKKPAFEVPQPVRSTAHHEQPKEVQTPKAPITKAVTPSPVVAAKAQPKEIETEYVESKKVHTEVSVKDQSNHHATRHATSIETTQTTTIIEAAPKASADKKTSNVVAAVGSDDEDDMDMPDIVMDGPDSDEDSE
ncbi:rRNA processing/ribosome biogenesis-domain-containing protein [Umbelopsis sp. AD052]|nr:rRNA processing/ribosome biogenesis-domain-containing protein [Umbelopsis sp. AD052]